MNPFRTQSNQNGSQSTRESSIHPYQLDSNQSHRQYNIDHSSFNKANNYNIQIKNNFDFNIENSSPNNFTINENNIVTSNHHRSNHGVKRGINGVNKNFSPPSSTLPIKVLTTQGTIKTRKFQ
eukprot:TRINITY_DN13883_c0_g1_i1.p1 TRINITY_DN13883_c0_g1~~TRINITY_DN13883_c0_g1_i1.p1  ORF type:complete len:123 (-),score=21.69 TRINITY_DN13883_c0_g1_i1:97-465(-)